MIIDNGVAMLELESVAFGSKATLCPTLVWDQDGAVLIDVGMPGSWGQIKTLMLNNGVLPQDIKAIILTHQDLDHIGSIEEIRQELGDEVQIYAHPLEKPYIEGEIPLIKSNLQSMQPLLAAIPEEAKQKAIQLLTNLPKARVDEIVYDGQELPYFGGIQVIHTPGHTEGHISLYLKKSKVLIAADAMLCVDGRLHAPVPQTSLDLAEAMWSLQKLLDYEIESVICYHGGLCEWGVLEQLQTIIGREHE